MTFLFFKSPVKWYPPVHYQPRPRSPPRFQRRSPGDEDFMGVFFRRVRAKKSKVRSMGWRISFSFSFIIHLFDFGTEECLIFVASLALCQDPKLQPNPRREGSPCNSLQGEASQLRAKRVPFSGLVKERVGIHYLKPLLRYIKQTFRSVRGPKSAD